ncbi:MAG: hypothetical protein DMF64_03005 [Acidobacteria bacterium]|nr:MAG: hypothetical protein DMF64_03005 [Acidobacteriota bacterium]
MQGGYREAKMGNKDDDAPLKADTGAFEPRDSRVSQQIWRGIFLEVVRKLEDKVLKKLSQEPLRFFRKAGLDAPGFLAPEQFDLWQKLTADDWESQCSEVSLHQFREALWAWGKHWKLTADWCLKAGFDTLRDWVLWPESLEELSWAPSIHTHEWLGLSLPSERQFSFQYPTWEFVLYLREEYEEAARIAFEAALKAYCDRIAVEAPRWGYIPIPPRKRGRKAHLPIEWLVRSRVQGWKVYEINKLYYPNSDNRWHIKKAIEEAAALIGL